MEQKQEKLYALLNEKLDHTEEISDEEILVEIDKLIWEEAKGQYMPLSEKITLRQQLFNGIRRLDILHLSPPFCRHVWALRASWQASS